MLFLRKIPMIGAAVLTTGALACCTTSNGSRVQLSNEKVIIVWDPAHQTQHFIRQARFDTKAKDFGFIVPTPSIPKLAVTDPAAFTLIESLIPREPSKAGGTAGSIPSASAPKSVEVISTQRVGDYQATIVKATDGTAMSQWLKKNGYVSRPAMTEWLDYYAKQGWVFTAFKFLKNAPTGTWTQAIRLSFKTDKPRYPYKMPKDTWPAGWRRPLNVYFIASGRAETRYVGNGLGWEAAVRWSGDLPSSSRAALAADLALKDGDLPENAVVTIFQNGHNPDGYDHDLYFTAQTPASTSWNKVTYGGMAIGGLALAYGMRRRAVRA